MLVMIEGVALEKALVRGEAGGCRDMEWGGGARDADADMVAS